MLYSREMYIPKRIKLPEGKFSLTYTAHAMERFTERRPNRKAPPREIKITEKKIETITTREKGLKAIRCTIKTHYNRTHDIVLALGFNRRHKGIAKVITAWFVHKNGKLIKMKKIQL